MNDFLIEPGKDTLGSLLALCLKQYGGIIKVSYKHLVKLSSDYELQVMHEPIEDYMMLRLIEKNKDNNTSTELV